MANPYVLHASDDQVKAFASLNGSNNTFNTEANLDINNLPDLLTIQEASELLRVSRLTIKRWGKRGKLEAIRINSRGDRRFRKESILYLLGIDPEDMKKPEDAANTATEETRIEKEV